MKTFVSVIIFILLVPGIVRAENYTDTTSELDNEKQETDSQYALRLKTLDEALEDALRRQDREETINLRNEKAIVYWEMNDYKLMIDELREALSLNPSHVKANYLMGNAWRWLGMMLNPYIPPKELIIESNMYYERAINNNIRNELIPYAYLFAGIERFQKRDWNIALKYLDIWLAQIDEVNTTNPSPSTIHEDDDAWKEWALQIIDMIHTLRSQKIVQ